MSDLLIRDVRLPDGVQGDVLIRAGRIARIGPALDAPADAPVLQGRGRLVLPGAIDMHVHFRTPGGEHKETLLSGARAAVKGGTTSCADMPNTSPRTTTLAALEQKASLARGALANLYFNFGAEPDNLDEVRKAASHPAVKALKIYMGPSTGQGGLAPAAAEAHFRLAAELGLAVMVHAEDLAQIEANAALYPHDVRHHHLLRSSAGELAAVRTALRWASTYGTRLYLAHCTLADVVRLAEDNGMRERVFLEACPHHLLLSVEEIASPAENRYKVNPPLRTDAERAALFSLLRDGIDGLGSDHAPHTLAEKEAPYEEAPSGIPGVEYLLPLALHWWREGEIGLARLIDLTSAHAARYFGLNKGRLEPGYDADLVLVEPDARWTIARGDDRVASKCDWTLYAGRSVRARPMVTIVAGRVVYEHGTDGT